MLKLSIWLFPNLFEFLPSPNFIFLNILHRNLNFRVSPSKLHGLYTELLYISFPVNPLAGIFKTNTEPFIILPFRVPGPIKFYSTIQNPSTNIWKNKSSLWRLTKRYLNSLTKQHLAHLLITFQWRSW